MLFVTHAENQSVWKSEKFIIFSVWHLFIASFLFGHAIRFRVEFSASVAQTNRQIHTHTHINEDKRKESCAADRMRQAASFKFIMQIISLRSSVKTNKTNKNVWNSATWQKCVRRLVCLGKILKCYVRTRLSCPTKNKIALWYLFRFPFFVVKFFFWRKKRNSDRRQSVLDARFRCCFSPPRITSLHKHIFFSILLFPIYFRILWEIRWTSQNAETIYFNQTNTQCNW